MWLRAGVTPLKKNRIRRNCFAGSRMSEQVGLVSLFVPALDRGKMGSYLNNQHLHEPKGSSLSVNVSRQLPAALDRYPRGPAAAGSLTPVAPFVNRSGKRERRQIRLRVEARRRRTGKE